MKQIGGLPPSSEGHTHTAVDFTYYLPIHIYCLDNDLIHPVVNLLFTTNHHIIMISGSGKHTSYFLTFFMIQHDWQLLWAYSSHQFEI